MSVEHGPGRLRNYNDNNSKSSGLITGAFNILYGKICASCSCKTTVLYLLKNKSGRLVLSPLIMEKLQLYCFWSTYAE